MKYKTDTFYDIKEVVSMKNSGKAGEAGKGEDRASRTVSPPRSSLENFSLQEHERDALLHVPEVENTWERFSDDFTVSRTIDGIPVSGNDFLRTCSVEDSDALRILLTARRRAGRSALFDVPGDRQVTH